MNSAIFNSRMSGVLPKDIICIFDYDKTLAAKNNPEDTDHAPLMAAHYLGLQELAERVGRLVIVTARGEKSVLNYLREHERAYGRLPNTTLASNSGHRWHQLDRPHKEAVTVIDIPELSRRDLDLVKESIYGIVSKLAVEYPDITGDLRELCGAVVFQFKGDKQSPQFLNFHARAEELKARLPFGLPKKIEYKPNAWYIKSGEDTVTAGYIDILPVGMSKSVTAEVLFNHYSQGVANPFPVIAGDSTPDFDMMTAVDPLVPLDRRLFICVGSDLVGKNNEFASLNRNRSLVDMFLEGNGVPPVDQMHEVVSWIGKPNRPSAYADMLVHMQDAGRSPSSRGGHPAELAPSPGA